MTSRSGDVESAIEASRIGARILLNYWEQLGKEDADVKARNDWVSRADRESESAIVSFLRERYPDDSMLGEEGGSTRSKHPNGRTWIIDPLDGTANYLQHFPFWSISIGLQIDDSIGVGVIHEPLRDLFFTAERGSGAFRNGIPMRVSDHASVEGAFLATGFPFRALHLVPSYIAIFQDVLSVARGVRRAGSAALDLAYTAAGVFDGFFELHLAPWDVAAGSLLVTEAGGTMTDFSGGSRWLERGNVVGASSGVHASLLTLIARHVKESDLDRSAAKPLSE